MAKPHSLPVSRAAGSLPLPERVSLPQQTAAVVRQGIQDGTWRGILPSERSLAGLLRVSRPTIRVALKLLAEERLIEISHGRSNRILGRGGRARQARSRLVVIVTPEPVADLQNSFYSPIAETRTYLAEHGFVTEVFVCSGRSAGAQQHKLGAFLTQNRAFCCILLSARREIQDWVAKNAIRSLIVGSCHPSVSLPSIDVDYRAVCRHAAVRLLARGHRHVALVVPDSGVAGDLESEKGFLEGVAGAPGADQARGLILRHDGSSRDLLGRLDAALDRPNRPTGLLVAKPDHTILVLLHLLRRGLRVPESISMIGRDQDELFSKMIPALTHYRMERDEWKHHVMRLILRMVRRGRLPDRPNLIFPTFYPGQTVHELR